MKKIILLTFVLLFSTCQYAYAQTGECPADRVCLTREAAIEAVENKAAVAAFKIELAAKEQAIKDHEKIEQDLLVKLAEKVGENTALKQNAIADREIISFLVKSVRPKKIGLINLF